MFIWFIRCILIWGSHMILLTSTIFYTEYSIVIVMLMGDKILLQSSDIYCYNLFNCCNMAYYSQLKSHEWLYNIVIIWWWTLHCIQWYILDLLYSYSIVISMIWSPDCHLMRDYIYLWSMSYFILCNHMIYYDQL